MPRGGREGLKPLFMCQIIATRLLQVFSAESEIYAIEKAGSGAELPAVAKHVYGSIDYRGVVEE